MARKNQWEQFANNFSSFYDLGNKIQTGIGAKRIMADEVETIQASDAGTSPHAAGQGIGSGTQYKYDGKMYKEEITADQLTGLRNKRLSDNMVKFGDSAGAMDFNLKNAQLRAANVKADLDEGTLTEQIARVKIENDAKIASMNLTVAETNRLKTLQPLEVRKALADIASTNQQTKVSQTKLPLEVREIMARLGISEQKAVEFLSVEATGTREKSQKNLNKEEDIKATKLDQDAAIQAGTYENALATAIFESGEAVTMAGARLLAAERNLQGNETLSLFAIEMGPGGDLNIENFENSAAHHIAQKEWLNKNWKGDKAVKQLLKEIEADELASITAEGSLMMAKVNKVFQGKSQNSAKKDLIALIDGQDGITGNMRWDTKDGKVQLIETDGDGEETIIEGTSWNNFKQVFYGEFTPLKSLEIAKSNADTQLVLAQAKKYNAEALIPPRDYSKEKWQGMLTQFMSSAQFVEIGLSDPDGSQGLAAAALANFKAQYNSDPTETVVDEPPPEGVIITQTN